MTATKNKILFLCTHNAARSQMAEGFVNSRHSDHYEACSAGNAPTRVHPCTVKVRAEEGIDISEHRAKAGYSYPTIRLPHTFSKLAELSTRIYQTVHDGKLAFLVVVSKGTATEKSAELSENVKK